MVNYSDKTTNMSATLFTPSFSNYNSPALELSTNNNFGTQEQDYLKSSFNYPLGQDKHSTSCKPSYKETMSSKIFNIGLDCTTNKPFSNKQCSIPQGILSAGKSRRRSLFNFEQSCDLRDTSFLSFYNELLDKKYRTGSKSLINNFTGPIRSQSFVKKANFHNAISLPINRHSSFSGKSASSTTLRSIDINNNDMADQFGTLPRSISRLRVAPTTTRSSNTTTGAATSTKINASRGLNAFKKVSANSLSNVSCPNNNLSNCLSRSISSCSMSVIDNPLARFNETNNKRTIKCSNPGNPNLTFKNVDKEKSPEKKKRRKMKGIGEKSQVKARLIYLQNQKLQMERIWLRYDV